MAKTGKLLGVLLIVSLLPAQVSFTAKVNRNIVRVGEIFEYAIEVVGANQLNIQLPNIPGFQVMNPNPTVGQVTQIINGKMTQYRTYKFYLKAERAGKQVIPALNIQVKGKTYTVKPVRMTVTKGNAEDTADDLRLVVQVSTNRPYVNEEVTVRTLLYVKNGVNVREYNFKTQPKITGVWNEDYALNRTQKLPSQVINDVPYHVYLLSKTAVFPLSPGKLTIGETEIVCRILKSRSNNRRRGLFDDPFDNFFRNRTSVNISVKSPKKVLTVQPVPGADERYSGFVGDLRVSAKLDKQTFKTNDGLKLTLTMSGVGNIQTLKVPEFYISPDIEQYDPTVRTSIERDGNKISGRKQVEYVLVPRVAGEQKIGPIELTYFNPIQNKMIPIKIDEMVLDVDAGKTFSAVQSGGPGGTSKKSLTEINRDIIYIKNTVDEFKRSQNSLVEKWYFIAAFPGVLMLFFAGDWIMRQRQQLAGNQQLKRQREAHSKARKLLKTAEQLRAQGDHETFFRHVQQSVLQYIADQTSTDAAGYTSDTIREVLSSHLVDAVLIERVISLSEKIDFFRYSSPADPTAEMETVWVEANDLLNTLMKEFA